MYASSLYTPRWSLESCIRSPSKHYNFPECNRSLLSTSLHQNQYTFSPEEKPKRATSLPRIPPQPLKPLSLPQRLPRNLHALRIHNPQTPPTNRLEPLPPDLLNFHLTAAALALLLVESLADKLGDFFFEASHANPTFAVTFDCVRALASASFVAPVELVDERGGDAREAGVAVAVPALGVGGVLAQDLEGWTRRIKVLEAR
jgi:hypothetical protein